MAALVTIYDFGFLIYDFENGLVLKS